MRVARRVRAGGSGRRADGNIDTAPGTDPTSGVTPLKRVASSNPVDAGWMAVRTRP